MTRQILATVCCALLIGAAAGYAQEVHKLTVEIPNPFTVSGHQLPAGRYDIQLEGQTHRTISVRGADGKSSAQGMIVTGIAAPRGSADAPRLVFDSFGGQYVLAEVWMPGHDGYLISGFKNDAEHQHSTVNPAPAKK